MSPVDDGQPHRCPAWFYCTFDNALREKADFALAFWMIHEVPERRRFLAEVRSLLKADGFFLAAEPQHHVKAADFDKIIALAEESGLTLRGRPRIALSHAALFGPGPAACLRPTFGSP